MYYGPPRFFGGLFCFVCFRLPVEGGNLYYQQLSAVSLHVRELSPLIIRRWLSELLFHVEASLSEFAKVPSPILKHYPQTIIPGVGAILRSCLLLSIFQRGNFILVSTFASIMRLHFNGYAQKLRTLTVSKFVDMNYF